MKEKNKKITLYIDTNYLQLDLLDKRVKPVMLREVCPSYFGPRYLNMTHEFTTDDCYFIADEITSTLEASIDTVGSFSISYYRGLPNYSSLFRRNEVINLLSIREYFDIPKFIVPRYHGDFLDFIEPNKDYVVKGLFCARGLFKCHFNTSDKDAMKRLKKFIKDNSPRALDDVLNEFKKNSENEVNKKRTASSSFIMEDIGYKNIREYRILLFKTGDYLIEKRTGYHPLDKKPRRHEYINYIPKELRSSWKRILFVLRELMVDANYPFTSFDLYVRLDKYKFRERYGIFEYSPEFGIDYNFDIIKKMRTIYTTSLLEWCSENKNKIPYKLTTDFKQITV